MPALRDRIIELLRDRPGLTDRGIADELMGKGAPQQAVNQACRALAGQGLLVRRKGIDGRIENHLVSPEAAITAPESSPGSSANQPGALNAPQSSDHPVPDPLGEDHLKEVLEGWLRQNGWQVRVAWGKTRGADIVARKTGRCWIIEVKGRGSRPEMRVNYFLGILGETLQRMSDPEHEYSIALPDLQQYRNLWERLPDLAKARTKITALFVSEEGEVARAGAD